MRHAAQSAIAKSAVLAALVVFFGLEGAALATTWTVHVGHGGTHYVDDVSGTNISTIHVGDTITWVWEGTMHHSVTSGTCDHAGGGGGYGGYGGGTMCEDGHVWTSTGLQSAGFTFSQTFSTVGTISYFCMMHLNAMTGKIVVEPAAVVTGPCVADVHTLCLSSGRFSVTAHWTKPDGSQGDGTGVSLTDDSGYFWFFDPTNIETISKVLNGCAIDNSYWVFAAGLTNVAVHLTVTDTSNGAVYVRDNAQGAAFSPIQDTAAFPSSCP
ncbi:MAG TPA: plastocyanin/azurin family copper-binding protein [Thermoanaerobaculia bacterium]|nr:plastocyanin/azurin family copper-binding protein [Thermoanaerobaculia bacterium]